MAFIAESGKGKFWFGTEQRLGWFPTPNRGADVSPTGWDAGGTLLNGGGYQLNSFGSHKNFIFEWPESSARQVAQVMKSYADGSYGRGLIYFIDPLTWTTNMLPAQWADPSMGLGYEGSSLVYGVDPVAVPTSGWESNDLPVQSAFYDLAGVASGWRGKEEAVFIPIPSGYTLSLGSFHSQSGAGRVFYREQATNGALGAISELTPLANNSSQILNTFVSGSSLAGIWLYAGKNSAGVGSVTLTAMIGRLIESVKTTSTLLATNTFTNPSFETPEGTQVVAENLFTNPRLVGDGTWAEVRRNTVPDPRLVVSSISNGISSSAGNSTSLVSDIADHPLGITTAYANTYSSETSSSAFGVHWGNNLGSATPGTTGSWLSNPVSPGIAQVFYAWGKYDVAVANFRMQGRYHDGSGNWLGASFVMQAGQAVAANIWLKLEAAVTPPAGAAYISIRIDNSFTTLYQAGSKFLLTGMMRSTPGPYFDGSAAQGSIDPDMRQRWLGTPNASESVMEIERVRGLTATRCIAGVSTRDGKPAARLIPTETSSPLATAAQVTIPVPARTGGVLLATVHNPLVVANTTGTFRTMVQQPQTYTTPTPTGGAHRNVFGVLTTYQGVLYGGPATIGSGDVWWTDIGLFAGVYEGEAFSGATPDSEGIDYSWSGTVDNSTSLKSVTNVAGVTGGYQYDGWAHEGTKSLRVPTGETATVATTPGTVAVVARNVGQTLLGNTGVEVRRNLVRNPTLRNDSTSWLLSGYGSGGSGTAQRVSGAGPDGESVFRCVWTNAASGGGASVIASSGSSYRIPCSPGDPVTVSAYVKRSLAGNVRIQITPYNSSGNPLSSLSGTDFALTAGTWEVINHSTTLPPDSASYAVEARIQNLSGTLSNFTFEVTRFLAEKSSTLNPYFDGSTPPSENGFTSWAGTPNASESIQYAANSATSSSPNETIRVQAANQGALLPGDWDLLTNVTGAYTGQPFSGDTEFPVVMGLAARTEWVGDPDASESTAWSLTPEFDILKAGPWIGGQGHSGVRFMGKPTYVNNTGVNGGQVSFAASFREIGSWVNG